MDAYNDLGGEIFIKSPSNRMEGKFVLYRQEVSEVNSEMLVAYRRETIVESTITARVQRPADVIGRLDIKYKGNTEINSVLESTSVNYLSATLEVRPHNRLLGKFELMEAPRVVKDLNPIEDATTRSRSDLQTVNYGDTQSMMIGQSDIEQFESFVNFGDLKIVVPDLNKLEEAKLRLYYSGSFMDDTDIKVYQPNTLWREYGITYANKPYGTELLLDSYTVNRTDKYIEFDVFDLVKRWQDESLINYGLIIKSDSSHPTYFNTRESLKPPVLQLKYITSQNYSFGRADLNSSLFIYGAGRKEVTGSITVKSNVGLNYLPSSLYVHKYKDFMQHDTDSTLSISRPDINSTLKVVYHKGNDLSASISVASYGASATDSTLIISRPDLGAGLTVDPKMSLESELTVAFRRESTTDSLITVSRPDMLASLTVSKFKHVNSDLESSLMVQGIRFSDIDSSLIVNKPDLGSSVVIRAIGNNDLDSFVQVPSYDYRDANVTISRPDLGAYIEVKNFYDVDGTLYVKNREYLGATIDIRQKSDLDSIVDIKNVNNVESEVMISRPELGGFLYPRLARTNDLIAVAQIRKRDVSDLSSFIIVKGRSSGVYWYIL
ncbi:UNVERIFIED_CONTAM: hypothetical protein ABIC26_002825 [Paenibacillus sp. PvR008]